MKAFSSQLPPLACSIFEGLPLYKILCGVDRHLCTDAEKFVDTEGFCVMVANHMVEDPFWEPQQSAVAAFSAALDPPRVVKLGEP